MPSPGTESDPVPVREASSARPSQETEDAQTAVAPEAPPDTNLGRADRDRATDTVQPQNNYDSNNYDGQWKRLWLESMGRSLRSIVGKRLDWTRSTVGCRLDVRLGQEDQLGRDHRCHQRARWTTATRVEVMIHGATAGIHGAAEPKMMDSTETKDDLVLTAVPGQMVEQVVARGAISGERGPASWSGSASYEESGVAWKRMGTLRPRRIPRR